MITAVPKGVFSSGYSLDQPHGRVGELEVSGWREKAELATTEGRFRLYRERTFSGAFVMEREGQVVARAVKPSALRAEFRLAIGGREFTLRRRGLFGPFTLAEGDVAVGTVRRAGVFTRRTYIDLPDDWSTAVRAYVFWLVLVIWTREAASAGA